MALLGLHGWENVIWIYILQRKKGPGGEAHCFCQIFKRVCNLKSVAIRGSNLFPLQWYFPWSVNVASFPITVSHRAETEWHVGFAFRNSVSAALVFFQARQKKKKKKKHTKTLLSVLFTKMGKDWRYGMSIYLGILSNWHHKLNKWLTG